jgi:catechol 2,3-dioxygenase-like lactoylglutathione lyase family enzyme
MRIHQLGHVVLKVRDRERSEQFYTEVLGLPVAARRDAPPMTFFTLGNHHDFAIMAVGRTDRIRREQSGPLPRCG